MMTCELNEYLKEKLSRCRKQLAELKGNDLATLNSQAILSVKIAALQGRIKRLHTHATDYEPEYTIPRHLIQNPKR